MKFEIRVPISPTPAILNRIKYLDRSLRSCGGITGNARLIIAVGDDLEPFDVASTQPWSHERIEWRWVDREDFRRHRFLANGFQRFLWQTDADLIMFADNDIIFAADIDELVMALSKTPVIAGRLAGLPPFLGRGEATNWEGIFNRAGLSRPQDLYEYSGWRLLYDDPVCRFSPAYFNFGAVFVPGSWLSELTPIFHDYLFAASSVDLDNRDFQGQLALTMAIYRLQLPRHALSCRYNFPNDPKFEGKYPDDLKHLRILHYNRQGIVDRDRDFACDDALENLIVRRDLSGSNELLRSTVERLFSRA